MIGRGWSLFWREKRTICCVGRKKDEKERRERLAVNGTGEDAAYRPVVTPGQYFW